MTYEALNAMSPEQYLVGEVKRLLLAQYLNPKSQVSQSGLTSPLTRWSQGRREGEIMAYLNAILAIRAGSAYYVDSRSRLRQTLLAEAISDTEE